MGRAATMLASFGGYTPLLLDGIANLGPVYSFRKLLSAYSGDCCIIRRSSDDTTDAFGFGTDNWVDLTAIASFVGGGTAAVAGWYDQNGNVVDVSQAQGSNNYQPAFIASSSLVGNRPTLRFAASSQQALRKNNVSYANLVAADAATIFSVLAQDGATSNNTHFAWGLEGGGPRICSHATYSDSIYFDFALFDSTGRTNVSQPTGWDDAGHVLELLRTTGDVQKIVVDGVDLDSAPSKTSTVSDTDEPFVIGAFASDAGTGTDGGSHNIYFVGDLAELIFIKADAGAARATIRASEGTAYGITV
jgi:hypothetical protein